MSIEELKEEMWKHWKMNDEQKTKGIYLYCDDSDGLLGYDSLEDICYYHEMDINSVEVLSPLDFEKELNNVYGFVQIVGKFDQDSAYVYERVVRREAAI